MYQLRAEFAAEELGGAIGDDLVGVGVGRRAGAGLEDIQNELVVELAWWAGDLLGGLGDGVCLARLQQTQVTIGDRRGVLDAAEGPDEAAVEALTAYGEVLDGALGGGAVVRALGHLERSHRVAFDPLRWDRAVPAVGACHAGNCRPGPGDPGARWRRSIEQRGRRRGRARGVSRFVWGGGGVRGDAHQGDWRARADPGRRDPARHGGPRGRGQSPAVAGLRRSAAGADARRHPAVPAGTRPGTPSRGPLRPAPRAHRGTPGPRRRPGPPGRPVGDRPGCPDAGRAHRGHTRLRPDRYPIAGVPARSGAWQRHRSRPAFRHRLRWFEPAGDHRPTLADRGDRAPGAYGHRNVAVARNEDDWDF